MKHTPAFHQSAPYGGGYTPPADMEQPSLDGNPLIDPATQTLSDWKPEQCIQPEMAEGNYQGVIEKIVKGSIGRYSIHMVVESGPPMTNGKDSVGQRSFYDLDLPTQATDAEFIKWSKDGKEFSKNKSEILRQTLGRLAKNLNAPELTQGSASAVALLESGRLDGSVVTWKITGKYNAKKDTTYFKATEPKLLGGR